MKGALFIAILIFIGSTDIYSQSSAEIDDKAACRASFDAANPAGAKQIVTNKIRSRWIIVDTAFSQLTEQQVAFHQLYARICMHLSMFFRGNGLQLALWTAVVLHSI